MVTLSDEEVWVDRSTKKISAATFTRLMEWMVTPYALDLPPDVSSSSLNSSQMNEDSPSTPERKDSHDSSIASSHKGNFAIQSFIIV